MAAARFRKAVVLGGVAACVASLSLVMAMKVFHGAAVAPAETTAGDLWNKHIVDSAVSLLKSGYLVLRAGTGPESYMLAQMNQKDKTYSHCGLVMVENGYPFVYHSIGGEDNPDARLRRDSACRFFSPEHNTGIGVAAYDFDAAQTSTLKRTVAQYYKQRPKFDMKFDLATDDYLYCAEFVYKAVNKAMDDTGYINTTTVSGFRFVGIDDLFVTAHARVVWQAAFKP